MAIGQAWENADHIEKANRKCYFQTLPIPTTRLSFVLGCHFLTKLGLHYVCLPKYSSLSGDSLASLLLLWHIQSQRGVTERITTFFAILLHWQPIRSNLHLEAWCRPEILWVCQSGCHPDSLPPTLYWFCLIFFLLCCDSCLASHADLHKVDHLLS